MEDESDKLASADIYITPPQDGQLSEEDSADEDQPNDINHLSGRQLSAEAEVVVRRQRPDVDASSSGEDSDDDDIPVADLTNALSAEHRRKTTKTAGPIRQWVAHDLESSPNESEPEPPLFLESEWCPSDLFELFFDDEVIDVLVENSVKYAGQSGNHTFEIDNEEMKRFLAILLLSGYTVVPRRRMYWSQQPDVHNEAVSKAMSRNRFDEILHFFHPANNEDLPVADKFGKVRVLLSMLNERWLLYRPDQKELSIDESMIPYFGRHGAKQHIHGKPIRFGFKLWSLATSSAYLVQCEPYQGASTGNTIPELGMGGSVVMDLISELPREKKYSLYFDNLFTSFRLMDRLTAEGFGATGTLRSNRAEKAPIVDQKLLAKKKRGSFDYVREKSSGFVMVRWHDNSVVTVVSNCHSVLPISQAKRWSNKEKKSIFVDQPHVISQYNRYMGGVDRLDQNIATYRISIRTKKWWWPVVSFLISASVNNAWLLYRLCPSYSAEKLDLLEFTRRIVNTYLQRQVSNLPRPSQVAGHVLPEVRFDGTLHMIAPVTLPKQRRCGECGKKVQRQCMKCNVPLHVGCFAKYHTKH